MAKKYSIKDEHKGLKVATPYGSFVLGRCSQKELKELHENGYPLVSVEDVKVKKESLEDEQGQ